MHFDDFSADLLSGNSFDHTSFDHSVHGMLEGRHTFHGNGDYVDHFDSHGHVTGHSNHSGNSVFHYDEVGHLTGTSNMLGNQIVHHDHLGGITGFDEKVGSNTMHYDSLHRLIGRTDAFGNEYDVTGRLLGWKH